MMFSLRAWDVEEARADEPRSIATDKSDPYLWQQPVLRRDNAAIPVSRHP